MVFKGVDKRVVFQKGGFGGCSPGTKTLTRVHSDVPPERNFVGQRGYVRMFPRNENRNESTFAKTSLLRNCPFGSPSEFPKRGICEAPGGGISIIGVVRALVAMINLFFFFCAGAPC